MLGGCDGIYLLLVRICFVVYIFFYVFVFVVVCLPCVGRIRVSRGGTTVPNLARKRGRGQRDAVAASRQ